jgi:hypothetical protein
MTLRPHHQWTNEGLNRTNEIDARNLAQEIANRENRSVELGIDRHGGYPQHYYVLPKGEKHRSFGFTAGWVDPKLTESDS